MTKRDDKAESSLPQIKPTDTPHSHLNELLNQLDDSLHELLASYRFYDAAIRYLTEPDQLESSEEWHFGLFLYQQHLQQQAGKVMSKLTYIKQQT